MLKKLTATGFKSFADKTEFEFDRGITCIVGPNGCGKSNVVDAIKWVLGEQSAKSLRGKNMLDVIFNGSGTRKSSGLAQVDLTFDNSDGTLATDQTEVVITRRLYRSGESEYLINKQSARLKDIREMFLDTGVGVDAYSVIEQGRVDLMLQANPQERRAIFEEAAGINKYKHQKKEALRRLERVNQNLQRVQDVVEEIEKRLRSVKLAAGKARNYEQYVGRLRELRSRHALSEYHRLRGSMDDLTKVTSELHDQVTAIRTELSSNETRTSETNVRIVDVEREMQEVESRLFAVQSQITAHQERIAASERRIVDQQGLLERSQERLSQFDEQVASLTARMSAQREAAAAIEGELATVAEEQKECQAEDTACAHDLNERKVAIEEAKETIFEMARRTSQLNNEIQGLGIQRDSIHAQKSKLEARASEIATALETAEHAHREKSDRRTHIDEVIVGKTRSIDETKARMAEAAQQRAALLEQLAAAKEYRSGLESRRQLLDEMDCKHEGLLAGAREILERRDAEGVDGAFSYVRGAVGELFETDVAHARLVEAVLGPLETYLVASDRTRLLSDMESLGELTGRIQTFVWMRCRLTSAGRICPRRRASSPT
ncbi:MAG: AAA family ATPase [Planctomycetes bacterium]|nr:AAA family ATPase [Planctomycetota bacterium]